MTDEEKLSQKAKAQAELEKLNLEKQKLTAEIKQLNKPWFKNPQFLTPGATIIIAIVGVILTFATGIFDAKRLDLQNQKSLLQIDIAKFENQKDSIQLLIISSKHTLDSLTKDNNSLRENLISTSSQLKAISIKYTSEKLSIIKGLGDVDRLLKEKKLSEAFNKLNDLVDKLNGITGRNFSNDFSNDFQ